jgi:hypothetical protein
MDITILPTMQAVNLTFLESQLHRTTTTTTTTTTAAAKII